MFHVRRRRQQSAAPQGVPPQITDWSPSPLAPSGAAFTCAGLHFGAAKGSGRLYLGDADTYEAATTLMEQPTSSWGDAQIVGTTSAVGLGMNAWAYVLTNEGLVNAAGYHVMLLEI
jgi:hypothetical protein